MPVNFLGPRLRGVKWCHRCSSTPRVVTPWKRDSSAAFAASSGPIAVQTVFHATPSWRANPATDACSRRICPIAQTRPGGQHRALTRDRGILLGEHPDRTRRLDALLCPLAPQHLGRGTERGGINQRHGAGFQPCRSSPRNDPDCRAQTDARYPDSDKSHARCPDSDTAPQKRLQQPTVARVSRSAPPIGSKCIEALKPFLRTR